MLTICRGNLSRTDLPNGVVDQYGYDALFRLDVLIHFVPDATPDDPSDNDRLAEFDYPDSPYGGS